jgi:hypothetical protein
MGLPPVIVGAVGSLATNPKVQDMAARLANNVYGRIMGDKKQKRVESNQDDVPARVLLQEILDRLDGLAEKSETADAFSILQAELDRRHHKQLIVTICFGVGNLVLVLGLIGWLVFS